MRRLIFLVFLFPILGCSQKDLPPEAYGIFEDLNDPAFQKRVEMTAQAVSLSIGVTLSGANGTPLVCRSEVPGGLRKTMQLQLACQGIRIPFKFEYRADEQDWVVHEEDSAPMIFTRWE